MSVYGLTLPLLVAACSAAWAAEPPDYLPDAEKAIADTVDPWGLPFSDALTRYEGRFADAPDAPFVMGVNHGLVKVLPCKYWYRGPSWAAGGEEGAVEPFLTAAGEVQSLQVIALPRVGAAEATYSLSVSLANAPEARVSVYREVFVRTSPLAVYPRMHSDRWPDPLVPEGEATVSGMDCGVFWVDIAIPAGHPGGAVEAHLSLSDGSRTSRVSVPIEVVPGLDLDPKAFPFVGWFGRALPEGELSYEQHRDMCALALEHHLMPVAALAEYWDAEDTSRFDEMHDFLSERGQRFFDIRGIKDDDRDAACAHIRAAGWIDECLIYNSPDEPDAKTFASKNIANNNEIHDKYPGVRTYLASEYHENMAQGCDIWLTDVSASRYDREKHRDLQAPELWHYYCHLPIHWQMRAPLVYAPNMQIDNPALEHRLALWMSWRFGARGVFIWAGFRVRGMPADFWNTLTLSDKPSGFPYAGVHNGNNYRLYPPRETGGAVLPSVRLKVTRDALQDIALMNLARSLLDEGDLPPAVADRLRDLLDPTPEVFVDFHYFDRNPSALLAHRDALLRALAEVGPR